MGGIPYRGGVPGPAPSSATRSRTRIRAERARGFSPSSASVGRSDLRVTSAMTRRREHTHTGNEGGQVQPAVWRWNVCLTMRSSSEWYAVSYTHLRAHETV